MSKSRWQRYRERLGDEREFVKGQYHVILSRGPFRSEIKVWKDVCPALGGLIGRRWMSDGEAERVYDEIVAGLRDVWVQLYSGDQQVTDPEAVTFGPSPPFGDSTIDDFTLTDLSGTLGDDDDDD
jgi:hypothetical protein